MKKFVVLFLAITMITSLQSCKKDKEESKPTAKELLTMDSWDHDKYEVYDSDGNLTGTNTVIGTLEFTPAGNYYYYDENGDLNENGKWEFSSNNSKLTLSDPDGSDSTTFDIEKLTKDKLNISFSDNTGKAILYFKR